MDSPFVLHDHRRLGSNADPLLTQRILRLLPLKEGGQCLGGAVPQVFRKIRASAQEERGQSREPKGGEERKEQEFLREDPDEADQPPRAICIAGIRQEEDDDQQ